MSVTHAVLNVVFHVFEAAEAEFQDLKQELRQQQEASGSCEIPYLGELVWHMQSQLLLMNHMFYL